MAGGLGPLTAAGVTAAAATGLGGSTEPLTAAPALLVDSAAAAAHDLPGWANLPERAPARFEKSPLQFSLYLQRADALLLDSLGV